MTSVFKKLFTCTPRQASAANQSSMTETSTRSAASAPLPMKSPPGKVGSFLRAAFTGGAKSFRGRASDHAAQASPASPLAARSVEHGGAGAAPWQAAQRGASERRGPYLRGSEPRMTLEKAYEQLGTGPVQLRPLPDAGIAAWQPTPSVLPGETPFELQDSLEQRSSEPSPFNRERSVSVAWSALRPALPMSSHFDALDEFDDEFEPGLDSAQFRSLTADDEDGEGLSEEAARAVIARMADGASRADALDALRDGELGVAEYARHAASDQPEAWSVGLMQPKLSSRMESQLDAITVQLTPEPDVHDLDDLTATLTQDLEEMASTAPSTSDQWNTDTDAMVASIGPRVEAALTREQWDAQLDSMLESMGSSTASDEAR